MRSLRLLLIRRGAAMSWLLACVLAVRLLVPAGYMPAAGPAGIAIGVCAGTGGSAMPAMDHGGKGRRDAPPPGSATPCAFAGLAVAALDPPAPAIARAAPRADAPPAFPLSGSTPRLIAGRWRPPLRAPPGLA